MQDAPEVLRPPKVTELPQPKLSRRHEWDIHNVSRMAALDEDGKPIFPDGNARTLRPCTHCGIIKVTVHSNDGRAWREWRTKRGSVYVGDLTPPCLGVVKDIEE